MTYFYTSCNNSLPWSMCIHCIFTNRSACIYIHKDSIRLAKQWHGFSLLSVPMHESIWLKHSSTAECIDWIALLITGLLQNNFKSKSRKLYYLPESPSSLGRSPVSSSKSGNSDLSITLAAIICFNSHFSGDETRWNFFLFGYKVDIWSTNDIDNWWKQNTSTVENKFWSK